jgi:hypothetical protein
MVKESSLSLSGGLLSGPEAGTFKVTKESMPMCGTLSSLLRFFFNMFL